MPKRTFTMTAVEIPPRKFCAGEKQMYTIRIPETLLKELGAISDELGWNTTDLVITVLDQYAQQVRKPRKRK